MKKQVIFKFDVTHMTEEEIELLKDNVTLNRKVRGIPVKIKTWIEPPPAICEGCGKQLGKGEDHWYDDGPNRSGWGCP